MGADKDDQLQVPSLQGANAEYDLSYEKSLEKI